MKTIRHKLSGLFFIFTLAVIVGGIAMNGLFLEDYYIYKNQEMFSHVDLRVRAAYQSTTDLRTVFPLIDNIDRTEGINCTLATPEMNARLNSFPEKQGEEGAKLPVEISDFINNNQEKLGKGPISAVITKPDEQMPKLVYVTRLSGGDLLILKKSIKGIRESVAIANQFYLISGGLILIVGGVFIAIFSKEITKPVVEMSNVAESISNLNFNHRVDYDAVDELGNLGRSINRISETLSHNIDELMSDVDRRKQLVRNLSHELKTPISIIKGYAEGLKFGVVEGTEATQKYYKIISGECDRMDRMIQELLSLSMLESGIFEVHAKSFDLVHLLKCIGERFSPTVAEACVDLAMDLPDRLIIEADPELIEQAVANYITNALNHVGGEKRIVLRTRTFNSDVQIEVFNTGYAIPEKDLLNIWDVFYKVDQARTRSYGGHGLGLSIVRTIADLHGGNATVANVDGGVIFYLNLPDRFHQNFT